MPEIKLKHVVSCSTEDTVSAPVWIYDQFFVELFLFTIRCEVKSKRCLFPSPLMIQNRPTKLTTC